MRQKPLGMNGKITGTVIAMPTKATAYNEILMEKMVTAVDGVVMEACHQKAGESLGGGVLIPTAIYLALEEVFGELCALSQYIDDKRAAR